MDKRNRWYIRDYKTKEIIAEHLNGVQSYNLVKELTTKYHDRNRFRRYFK